MPTPTYVPLATITLTSDDTGVLFSNIPSGFRDLIIVAQAKDNRSDGDNDTTQLRINSDSGSNYSSVQMGFDSSVTSNTRSGTSMVFERIATNSGNFSNIIYQIMDYSATDKHKTVLASLNQNASRVFRCAGRWASTSAITSVELQGGDGWDIRQWKSGSTFSLYGIAA
jgi:hypothetical protein